jgi:DUF4097 and DUF4098 domain-containing protein YvlB
VKLALAFLLVLVPASARAEETEVTFAYVPAPNVESMAVDQPLGRLTLNGWDKPEVRIVARKHAKDSATLDQLRVNVELDNGKIRIRTGVRVGDTFHPLPVAQGDTSAGIDLSIDAPRGVALRASTWAGDLEAQGFRAGAALSSRGGEVHANDIEGEVRTNALKGKQRLSAIRGNIEADGVTGDVEIDMVDGDLLEAKVVEGQITARRVHSALVRLFSSSGVVLIGALRPGARYEVIARGGDVRLVLERTPFTVRALAPAGGVHSAFTLDHAVGSPTTLQGDYLGGGPQLLLTALHGNVLLSHQ